MFKLSALALAAVAAAKDAAVTVTIADGVLEGEHHDSVDRWRSIPFAAPPTGDLRFRPPQPLTPWEGTLDARKEKPACPQLDIVSGIHLGQEDCLHLNVYRPHTDAGADADSNELLPVLFWIFGGGFSLGSGWEFGIYSGENLAAEHGVIVVAPNYRVNAFGFMALDALQEEDPDNSTGNMGIRDQRFAMQWVQDNIEAFGGDPNQVTIFGESAGAFSVCHHLSNAAASAGLFHGAIMESGTCDAPEFFQPLDDAKKFGGIFAAAMGCPENDDVLTCLRGLDEAHLMDSLFSWLFPTWPYPPFSAAAEGDLKAAREANYTVDAPSTPGLPAFAPVMPWGPAVDGTTVGLPDKPLFSLRDGKGMDVPSIIGFNHNEGAYFTLAMPLVVEGASFPPAEADVRAAVTHVLTPQGKADQVDTVMQHYDASTYGNWDHTMAMILRDYVFTCPERRALRAMADGGNDAFQYHFTYTNSHWIDMILFGDYHASELVFVFDNQFPVIHPFNKEDQKISDTFGKYWTNMAKTGTPNHPEAVDLLWPLFNSTTDTALILDSTLSTQSQYNKDLCDMWDEVLGY